MQLDVMHVERKYVMKRLCKKNIWRRWPRRNRTPMKHFSRGHPNGKLKKGKNE